MTLSPSFRLAVVVLSAAVLSGCATIRSALSFQEPQLELKEINVTGFALTGGTVDLVVDVYNPNDYWLRSTRLEVSLDLEGRHFGEAVIYPPLDLSPENHSPGGDAGAVRVGGGGCGDAGPARAAGDPVHAGAGRCCSTRRSRGCDRRDNRNRGSEPRNDRMANGGPTLSSVVIAQRRTRAAG